MRPKGSAELLQGRRVAAAAMFARNVNRHQVCKALGVSYSTSCLWFKAWSTCGVAALAPKPRLARRRKLSPAQLRKVESMLLQGASKAGVPDDTWTCPRVRTWILERFQVDYHVNHLGRLLKQLGMSPRYPKRRALERDEKQVENFRKRVWPAKKRGPAKKALA